MERLKKLRLNLAVNALLTVLIGICLIVRPGAAGWIIAVVAGIAILIAGIVDISRCVSLGEHNFAFSGSLIFGIIKVILGVIILTHTGRLLILLSYILGIFVIVGGVGCMEGAIRMKDAGAERWIVNAVLAAVVLAAGLFMVIFPFRAVTTAIVTVGVVLVVVGVIGLFIAWQVRRNS